MLISKKDVAGVDLEDTMHPGIFTGARRFRTSQIHSCKLCGFQTHNSAYFCTVNACDMSTNNHIKSTDEFMVSQMSEDFAFLKMCSKKDIDKTEERNSRGDERTGTV